MGSKKENVEINEERKIKKINKTENLGHQENEIRKKVAWTLHE